MSEAYATLFALIKPNDAIFRLFILWLFLSYF